MAVPRTSTRTWNDIASSTYEEVRKGFVDQVHLSNPLDGMLKQKGRITLVESMGERYLEPLMYQENQEGGHYGEDGILSTTKVNTLTTAAYEWAYYSVPIVITEMEYEKNRGEKNKIIDLWQAKITQARLTTENDLSRVNLKLTAGADEPEGIASRFVRQDTTSAFTVGGIDQAHTNDLGNTWWTNQLVDSAATTWAGLLTELTKLITACNIRLRTQRSDLGLVDNETWPVLQGAARDKQRLVNTKFAELGFSDNFVYEGVTFISDAMVPDPKTPAEAPTGIAATGRAKGAIFLLNTAFLAKRVVANKNFIMPTPVRPWGEDVRGTHIIVYYTMSCSNRAKQGLLSDIDLTIAA